MNCLSSRLPPEASADCCKLSCLPQNLPRPRCSCQEKLPCLGPLPRVLLQLHCCLWGGHMNLILRYFFIQSVQICFMWLLLPCFKWFMALNLKSFPKSHAAVKGKMLFIKPWKLQFTGENQREYPEAAVWGVIWFSTTTRLKYSIRSEAAAFKVLCKITLSEC